MKNLNESLILELEGVISKADSMLQQRKTSSRPDGIYCIDSTSGEYYIPDWHRLSEDALKWLVEFVKRGVAQEVIHKKDLSRKERKKTTINIEDLMNGDQNE